jgi:hypothetical protein
VDDALGMLRNAVLAGQDTAPLVRLLTASAAEVASLLVPEPHTVPAPPPSEDRTVTERVTDTAQRPQPEDESTQPRREATKRVTKPPSMVPIDIDTVQLHRETDPVSPGWHVTATTLGRSGANVRIGFLERSGGRWTARTAHSTTVAGGPWPTRDRALVGLVSDYQHRVDVLKHRR